jgi:hypothetical protein
MQKQPTVRDLIARINKTTNHINALVQEVNEINTKTNEIYHEDQQHTIIQNDISFKQNQHPRLHLKYDQNGITFTLGNTGKAAYLALKKQYDIPAFKKK